MASAMYVAKRANALASLKRSGTTLTMTIPSTSSPDAVTGRRAATAPVTQSIVALVTPASVSRDMTTDVVTLLRRNHRHLTIAALAPDGTALAHAPEDGCTVQIEGAPFRLFGVSPFCPDAQTTILYEAEAKR